MNDGIKCFEMPPEDQEQWYIWWQAGFPLKWHSQNSGHFQYLFFM